MAEIIPAIIGNNFAAVLEKIKTVESLNLIDWVQLDITDGIFTPEYSWQNAGDLEQLNGKLKLEAHLMVDQPENIIADWWPVVDRIIIHEEATSPEKILEIINKLSLTPVEFGLVLLLETDLEKLVPFGDKIKNVQLMSIATIGHYGEKLDERVYNKIKALRQMSPDVKISVDGGVNLANAKRLIEAGADRLVVGSGIWQTGNINETIKTFQCI